MNSTQRKLDLGFLGFLLILSAVVFGFFRSNPVPNAYLALALVLIAGGAAFAWIWLSRNRVRQNDEDKQHELSLFNVRDLVSLAVLAAATIILFFPLMKLHFDTGTDLSVAFGVDKIWFEPWADINRPLVGLGPLVAMMLTPGHIGGFFIVDFVARLATASFIYGVLRILFPARWAISFIVGLLFIINPAELSRFNLWSIYYQVALFFLAIAFFFFVYSYKSGSRLCLVASCVLLAVCFLQYEHGYPLAAVAPLSLLLIPRRSYFIAWLTAWYGIIAIFAARLATHLVLKHGSYQVNLFLQWGNVPKTIKGWFLMMIQNFAMQMEPLFRMIPDWHDFYSHPLIGLLVFVGVFAVLWILLRGDRSDDSPRSLLNLTLVGLVAVALGVLVYVPFPVTTLVPDYGNNPTLRYQYFAGPGHALFWGAAIGFLASLLRGKLLRMTVIAGLAAILCAGASVSAVSYQLCGGVLNPYYNYDTASRVLRQIDEKLPETRPGDLLFLEIPDTDRSPIGWDYTGFHWSCRLFGIPATQGRVGSDGRTETRVFSYADAQYRPGPACSRTHYFHVSENGDVNFIGTVENMHADASKCPKCVLRPYLRAKDSPLPFVTQGENKILSSEVE